MTVQLHKPIIASYFGGTTQRIRLVTRPGAHMHMICRFGILNFGKYRQKRRKNYFCGGKYFLDVSNVSKPTLTLNDPHNDA